jgi:DNA repair and recombination protein RAD54B
MCDIVNPGILGSLSSFKRVYEKPINIGHNPSATTEEKKEAACRAQQVWFQMR